MKSEDRASTDKRSKTYFHKPFKEVGIDLGITFFLNMVVLFLLLSIEKDPTFGMLSVIWVGIIAWRGGLLAGFLACVVMYFSNFIVVHLPPNNHMPMVFLFNKIPGYLVGFLQCVVVASVVGYISTLVHSLKHEIALRKKIQKELEQSNAEVNAFGHTLAHDLKNPLMIINLSIDSLVEELANSTDLKIKKKLAYINNGTKHMIDIVEAILMLAGIKKINSTEVCSFPIGNCIDAALKRIEYNIEASEVTIKKPDTWPTVIGYAPWITEVWVNYITNAIKYGGDPSQKIKPVIELGYDHDHVPENVSPKQIRFWVKDNGKGIAEDKIGTLFTEFTRLHTTEQEGHGLGLSIVKSVIDKFNGKVGVESSIGKGSLFYFTLPQI